MEMTAHPRLIMNSFLVRRILNGPYRVGPEPIRWYQGVPLWVWSGRMRAR
ncbi:hypothetical protein DSCOOX_64590 [Desulfosarcina ovata subsp. ovata]|uniref:Uncharacterized protein n=1 Tax=Desulfosarcina ovata subsp. ovata TaxID=2752305 RepID=A0A5K8AL64_9BACT|nr:hypothetical protein DSCOOX_64590 [Desulfosarcina ovata subsp. ovata]